VCCSVDRDGVEVVGRRGRDRRRSREECILITRVFGLTMVKFRLNEIMDCETRDSKGET